jgi:hypothetical protein
MDILVYEGQWKNDVPHGKGKFVFFMDAWVYEGQFLNGMFNKEGTVSVNSKVVKTGRWYNFLL